MRLDIVLLVLTASVAIAAPEALAGKAGPEFQVNTYTSNAQSGPSVAGLAGGGFVATWTSYNQDSYANGVFGQRYSAKGSARGKEFPVNTYVKGNQQSSAVAGLANGGFVVTWESNGQDGDGFGVYGQRFNAKGKARGKEFRANSYKTSYQQHPSVAGLSGGGFVVVWQSEGQDGSGSGIYGQRYNSTGKRKGKEFRINSTTETSQTWPVVDDLSDGGFVVAWSSSGVDYHVYAQRYNAKGHAKGAELDVTTYEANYQRRPAVAGLSGGGFVVLWAGSGLDDHWWGVRGQRYNAKSRPRGGAFPVNTYTTNSQGGPYAASLSNGGFIATWLSNGQDGDQSGVYGQRFDEKARPKGSEIPINTYTMDDQDDQSVTGLSNGAFVATWTSETQDDGGEGVYGKHYRK